MAMDRSSRPMHRGRKKVCSFCVDRVEHIDYKDLPACANTSAGVPRSFPAASPALALSSAQADRCYQACSSYGSHAVRQRLILTAAE